MALAAIPVAKALASALSPSLLKLGTQAAMSLGGTKGVSELLEQFKRLAGTQAGRHQLLSGGAKGLGLGLKGGHEVLGALNRFGILGNQRHQQLSSKLKDYGGSAQKAFGSLFKLNKRFAF